jgi:hypothetical protein
MEISEWSADGRNRTRPRPGKTGRRIGTTVLILASVVFGGVAGAVTADSSSNFQDVYVYRETADKQVSGAGWIEVHSSGIGTGLVVVRFSAESACWGGGANFSGYCSVRILIGPEEGAPAAGTDFAFDSADWGDETNGSWEAHSMERSRRVNVNAQITVQARTNDPSVHFRLDDWHVTVMRFS